jgi:hypothetical protein
MIGAKRQHATVTEEGQFQSPPPARFDDRASANAQPVEPPPKSGPDLWRQRARDFQRKVGVRTKALALVVVGGLAIGAASGAMLANRHQSSLATPVIEQSNVETAATEDPIKETASTGETISAQGATMAMQGTVQPARIRRNRSGGRTQPRAYRVAVIK